MENGKEPEQRLFTQAELNEIVKKRLAREKQKITDLKYYIAYLEARLQENKGSDKR